MSKTIWKFKLNPGMNTLLAPRNAKPISAKEQNGEVMMWAIVDPEKPRFELTYYCAMTGEELLADDVDYWGFLDTVILPDVGIVVHVFIGLEETP